MSAVLPLPPPSFNLPDDSIVALTSEEDLILHRLVREDPKIVAAVRLSGSDIHVAKTLGPGHYTVWGEAEELCERASIVHHES